MNLTYSRNTWRLCSTLTNLRKERWDLLSAVCVERKPVVSKDKNEIETKFSRLLARIELENSFKSDHEVRMERDLLQAELLKTQVDIDVDQTLKQTAQDFEDASTEEFKKFQFESRLTEADKTNNVYTHHRKLDRHLLLLIQQQLWDNKVWIMPQGKHLEGESMLQTAERVLNEKCGSDLIVEFLGNAPCGVYKYKYPKKFRNTEGSSVGAKVFFFKAQYIAGQINNDNLKPKDFKWLVREELDSSLSKEYCSSISQFLIDED